VVPLQAAVAVAERKDIGQSRMSAATAGARAATTAYSDSKASQSSSTAHNSDAKGMPPTDSTESNNNSSDAAQAKHDDTEHATTAHGHSSSANKSTDDDDAKADAMGDVSETVRNVTDTTADATTAAAEAKQSSRRSSSASSGVQHSDSKAATDTADQHAAAAANMMSSRVNSDDVALVDSPLIESDLPNQLSEISVQVIETVVTHPDTAAATDNTAATKTTSSTVAVEKPVHLSIESTPEFMQLPLEFQGFCPWTIVHRRGLLLAGRPELGVQRWKGAHYVFAHKVAAAVSLLYIATVAYARLSVYTVYTVA
jgi:Domain of unknown function